MQTVILAAGEGTRMRPLTETVPKPMLPVADRPLCAHTADAAVEAGASELVFVVGYEADAVREHFGAEYRGVEVSYAVQEEQLGTAHAVDAASDQLDGDFVVLNGDDLYDTAAVQALFENCPAVGAYQVEDPRPYGVFSLDGDVVTDVVEKPEDPPSDRVNVGLYHFPEAAIEWLSDVEMSERGEYEITDVVERLVAEREVRAVPVERWLGVGRPWELLEANEWKLDELEGRVDGEVKGDADLRGDVVVEEGATIEQGVVIEGPALVKSGADVGPNAYVRGATLVGEDCHIGHGVEIKNSVVMQGSNVPHLSYVGDSLLGTDVNFGAGTQVANLRHDGEPVAQTVKGDRVETGRRKYGVVAGPGAKTGINSSLSPGLVLSAEATTEPGESVTKDR
ncbi:NTP transferase domain-containing protein [Natronomonas salina]|uniref:bifunctional sugar-1-phosphate nucleotidylyltransferase/acetyltransferase n=1 Tax=Natronomonas salina TaxID=1710540 RepID=UPI0015B6D928|nr:bifunctional sugar-1-phosphate nucleotidylyltransferase/acetyltransferase [Natronomonas salina]QLD87789.1 NTP transferase domain-containing protein [Natronomonas salina]